MREFLDDFNENSSDESDSSRNIENEVSDDDDMLPLEGSMWSSTLSAFGNPNAALNCI